MWPYLVCFALLLPSAARTADFHGEGLGLLWGLPFALTPFSIALCPPLLSNFRYHHFGKITAFWAILFLVPLVVMFGFDAGVHTVVRALVEECIPFILLLLALYTISGGILVWGNLHGSLKLDTVLPAIGTALTSVMGTISVVVLMIRPLLKANGNRRHQVHVVVFFIFLVVNIGGGLAPLGDPPLFLGFLKGVESMWMVHHMMPSVLINATVLLTVFYIFDSILYAREGRIKQRDPASDNKLWIFDKWNFLLLADAVGAVSLSGVWKPDHPGSSTLDNHYALLNLVCDVILLTLTVVSPVITPKQVHAGNEFNFEPIIRVGRLFLGIFVTILSVLAILKAGETGAFHSVVPLVHDEVGNPINTIYFRMSSLLLAFLDSVPTYLVFFNMAGGSAQALIIGPLFRSLLAISMGSVLMGTVTYIGNAPNSMIKAIAEQREVKIPSFFGCIAWLAVILMPLFVLLTVTFFIFQLVWTIS